MSEQTINYIKLSLALLAMGLSLFWVFWRTWGHKLAPVKTVKAKVVDKNRIEHFSKYSVTGKSYRYAIVFESEGKKLSFYVSEFSYGGYRKGEIGTLQYQGSRIIDFS